MNFCKILLGLLGVWGVTAVILGLLDLHIVFPFNLSTAKEIPYHRWQTVRFTTFLTMAYFCFRFVGGFRPVSALGVLDMFFKVMVLIATINFWIADALIDDWGFILFIIIVALVTHRTTKINRGTMFMKEW